MPNEQIQLLPATRKEVRVKKPLHIKGFILPLGIMGIVLAAYFGLNFYKQSLSSKLASIDQEILNVERARNKDLEKKILNLNTQLGVVNPLLANHIMWSNGFAKFQSLIHPQVQVKSLTVDVNEINMQGIAADYMTVARQAAAFFSEETLTGVALGRISRLQTGQTDFSVQLDFEREKLLK